MFLGEQRIDGGENLQEVNCEAFYLKRAVDEEVGRGGSEFEDQRGEDEVVIQLEVVVNVDFYWKDEAIFVQSYCDAVSAHDTRRAFNDKSLDDLIVVD